MPSEAHDAGSVLGTETATTAAVLASFGAPACRCCRLRRYITVPAVASIRTAAASAPATAAIGNEEAVSLPLTGLGEGAGTGDGCDGLTTSALITDDGNVSLSNCWLRSRSNILLT